MKAFTKKAAAKELIRKPHLKSQLDLHLLLLPAVLVTLIFAYLPMPGVIIAFKEFSMRQGIFGSEWVGFDNFKTLLSNPFLLRSLRNSVCVSLIRLAVLFPAPIFLALMFNEIQSSRVKRTYQTVSYFPYFISWSVVCTMAQFWLSPSQGWVNPLLEKLGLINTPITFLSEPGWFWAITIILEFWKGIGFSTIIFLAAISGVDQEQYEAAVIDGASRLQKIKYITWPAIQGTVSVLFILQIPGLIGGNFDVSYLLRNPATASMADNLQTFVYDTSLGNGDFSQATAAGLIISLVSLILLLGGNQMVKRINNRGLF